jgi:hypothetical protein
MKFKMFNRKKGEAVSEPVQVLDKPINLNDMYAQQQRMETDSFVSTATTEQLPTTGGRSSQPEGQNLYGIITGMMEQTQTPSFSFEIIKIMEHLAKYNGDISYAVDNIVQLGNTPQVVTFDEGVPKDQVKNLVMFIRDSEKSIYSGGMNSLQNDLFAQLAITGALSYEKVPHRTVTHLAKVVLVSPHTVRAKYNTSLYDYEWYQQPPSLFGSGTSGSVSNLIKLNPKQYKYFALRRFNDNPYGIPPMMSALESIEIEKDMLTNFRHIVKKLGLFGFLSVLVTPPRRTQNETDTQYYTRCANYLDTLRPQVEKGFTTGTVIGFKGTHEFEMEGVNTNMSGAKEVINLITEMKMAGIKQDPLMLGRNFNVAETMARVIMAKLTTQVANYQRLVASAKEDIYLTMLLMAGFKVKSVSVEYKPPMIGDKLRDEQAFAAEIENRITLRDRGIIGQEQTANELTYERAYSERDVDYTVPKREKLAEIAKKSATDPKATNDPNQASDPTASGSTDYSSAYYERMLHRGAPEFIYDDAGCGCNNTLVSYASDEDFLGDIDEWILQYRTVITTLYRKSIDKAIVQVAEQLSSLSGSSSLQEVTDNVLYTLFKEWNATFAVEEQALVKKFVEQIYNFFRQDASYMPQGVVKATLDLFDVRAINYMQNSDGFYLGRFITDKDTKLKVTEYIKEKYLKNGTPIGKNSAAVKSFKAEFRQVMDLEGWKIRRIVDTSVNKMRNAGALAYMKQADIAEYEIHGVVDGRQCGYCFSLQGKRFKVGLAFSRVDRAFRGLPEMVAQDMPFVTTVFPGKDGLARFENASTDALQLAGISIPPFHSHCRDVIVAVQ